MPRTIITAMLLLVLVFAGTGSSASTLDKLEDKLEDLERQRKEAEAAIQSLSRDSKEINRQLAALDLQMYDLNTKIYNLEGDLAAKEEEIVLANAEVEAILARQEKHFEDTKERIKVIYEYGNTGYLEVLLDSADLSDFFSRMEYVGKVAAFDKQVMDELVAIQEDLEAMRSQLEVQRSQLDSMVAEAESKMDEMEGLVQSKNKAKAQIENDKEAYEEKMAWLKEQEAIVDKAIKAEIAKSQLKYGGGKFSWPVPGWYNISSRFGPRLHPVFKTWRNHDGIDIPASYGTPIKAAASGKVIISGWSNGYGNYVVIDHGSGYASIYAHASKLLVSKGQSVARGDTIAKIGSTGWSTGNHLHFGIQLNGKWVNPEPLLKAN